jgi:enoyl-CoA hydratase/carnithine racemase
VSQDNLLYTVSGRVARITLNRPKFRNALSYDLIELLIRMLRTFEADTNVKCILIQGAGEHFCAGGDMLFCGSMIGLPSLSIAPVASTAACDMCRIRSVIVPPG